MRPFLSVLPLLMLLSGCLFDDDSHRNQIDTRNDHDPALLGKWLNAWNPPGEGWESFDGALKRSEFCTYSGCDRLMGPYRTINDTVYQDSVTYTKCDVGWNNCKTTVFVPINGTGYGFYGDTLWLEGRALKFVRE